MKLIKLERQTENLHYKAKEKKEEEREREKNERFINNINITLTSIWFNFMNLNL